MAIIYKHGKQKSFTTICPKCGCVFEYTVNEINPDNYIKCPDCDNYVKHTTPQNERRKIMNACFLVPRPSIPLNEKLILD